MRFILTVFLISLLHVAAAQTRSFNAGLLPEIVVSYKWNEKLQHTTKIESLHKVFLTEPMMWNYSYEQTDIQTFLEWKVNPFWKIAGGYQYRLKTDENAHRAIQQAALVQKKTGFRLGHRWRTDQTFYTSDVVKWRARYRLSAEIPLEGQSLDDNEYYLILSGEPVYSLQDGVSDIESRVTASLGYFINSTNKLETGFDYRLEKLPGNSVRQNLWLKLGWYYIF